jgi:hypothetical protein
MHTLGEAARPPLRASASLRIAEAGVAGRLFVGLLIVVWVAVAAWAVAGGIDYYRLPLAERAFSSLHDAYKPSGTLGHLYGVAGTTMMAVGVALYSARKRMTLLAKAGKLRYWLQFHIFLCTLGPFLVLLHTSFRVGGIVSIAFWSMVVVVGSGVFGRYLYAHIPKSINGRFLSLKAIESERQRLLDQAAQRAGLEPEALGALVPERNMRPGRGAIRALLVAAKHDLGRRRRLAAVRRRLIERRVHPRERDTLVNLIGQEMELEHQMLVLAPFQRLFGYWHILHLPLALVMLFIVIVHVVVAVAFGYGWLL